MSFAMIQLFLFVFFIVLAIGVVWKIRLLRGKRVIWVLGGYVAFLLISVGLFLPIAEEQDTAGDGLSSETVVRESEQLEEAAEMGDLDDSYLQEQWSFDYDEEALGLEVPSNLVGRFSIYVEEKEESDQTLEAAYYQVPSTAEGQEVKNPHAPTLNVEEDTMIFAEPESVDMEGTVFEEPFSFHQFEDERRFDLQIGGTLLYLRIPEGLELNTTERVTYVNG